MLRHAPVTAGKTPSSVTGGCACKTPMRKQESPAGPVHHRFGKTPCACQRKAEIGQAGDAFERQADRVADAVVGGGGASAVFEQSHGSAPALQRQEGGAPAKEKKPSDGDKYKEAAKKAGEAFLETDVGKELKKKAETLGKDFIASLAGKIMTGAAVTGAVTAIIATNSELPIGIPEIPLDTLHPGLKLNLTYEGPVRNPSKVMVGFSVPLGRNKQQPKKKTLSKAEQFRQETARMGKELNDFRQGLKSPEERKNEDDAFWRAYWGGMNKYGLKPLGIPGLDEKEKPNLLKMRRKPVNPAAGAPSVPVSVPETLSHPGRPLDEGVRGLMQRRLGVDLGHVRIHTDAKAGRSARGIAAQAYTVGHHVVFGAGRYQPHADAGKRLIAHELTHVLQQAGLGPVARSDTPPAMRRERDNPIFDAPHPETAGSGTGPATKDLATKGWASKECAGKGWTAKGWAAKGWTTGGNRP